MEPGTEITPFPLSDIDHHIVMHDLGNIFPEMCI